MSEDLQQNERIARLIVKHLEGSISAEEHRELMTWCDLSGSNRLRFDKLTDPDFQLDKSKELPDLQSLKRGGWEKVTELMSSEDVQAAIPMVRQSRISWRRYSAVASVMVLLIAGSLLYYKYSFLAKTEPPLVIAPNFIKNDVAPGGNKALLTLSDGSTVVLDSAGKGTIAHQGNTNIEKVDNGKLAYKALNEKSTEITYNTLTTPAAGQFQLALPDGSKVWLNNASSLRYPVAFAGKDREVELQGEAYFEVARDAARPFKVKTAGVIVDVLGTSFNVAAYSDESQISTTLLTGAVRVSEGASGTLLKPGEQVEVNSSGSFSVPKAVDADGVIAWKNGLFHFERADIKSVMKILSRWYDVEVQYEGPVTSRVFGGDIERKLNLSEVLEILQKNQVHFSLEGKKITVRN